MKKWIALSLCLVGSVAATQSFAQAVVGQAAPSFTSMSANGKSVSLADFRGKYVVLEWFNPSCPFTRKHYDSGNMQNTQRQAEEKGVVWFSVNTSGETRNANETADVVAWLKEKKAAPTAILADDGKVARAYAARTTPHLYLIDPNGKLIYAGAIDSKASTNPTDIPGAVNFVSLAIDEARAGKPLSRPVTQPYGCAVKY